MFTIVTYSYILCGVSQISHADLMSPTETSTLSLTTISTASKNLFFLLSCSFLFFFATTGTLSRRFARGCSLSLGRLVSLKPLCLRRQECVWESASRKNRVARWKVSRWGFRPPGLHLIVEEGRCIEYKLSLAPFFLFLFVYSGRGRQPTYIHEEKKRGEGVPWDSGVKAVEEGHKWKQPMLWSFSWLRQSVLACWRRAFGLTYYWIWTNDSRRMKAIL